MNTASDRSLLYNNQRLTLERDPSAQTAAPRVAGTRQKYHHYTVPETGEKLTFCNELFVNIPNPADLTALLEEYSLEQKGRMGDAYVLALTEGTQGSPVQLANALSADARVSCAEPHMLVDMCLRPLDFTPEHPGFSVYPMTPQEGLTTPVGESRPTSRPDVTAYQWYLDASKSDHPDVLPNAGVDVLAAWELLGHKGDPKVVGAVLDDGFPITPLHEGLIGIPLHPDMFDFYEPGNPNSNPNSRDKNFHGPSVLGLGVSVAPGCTFQLARLNLFEQSNVMEALQTLSKTAHVVNCSFGSTTVSSVNPISTAMQEAITEMTLTGGGDGKGLLICVGSGNSKHPAYLAGKDNTTGVTFHPPGSDVYAYFANMPNVLVVGATRSCGEGDLPDMASYSGWRGDVDNERKIHFICGPSKDAPGVRGQGLFTMINPPGQGTNFRPVAERDHPDTPFSENHWTDQMGGTSGATPIVVGVAMLTKSAHFGLGALDIITVLETTATKDLSPTLQPRSAPYYQGLSAAFNPENGESVFYGAGKVNAFNAVTLAQTLRETDQGRSIAHNTPARQEEIRALAKRLWQEGALRTIAGKPSEQEQTKPQTLGR